LAIGFDGISGSRPFAHSAELLRLERQKIVPAASFHLGVRAILLVKYAISLSVPCTVASTAGLVVLPPAQLNISGLWADSIGQTTSLRLRTLSSPRPLQSALDERPTSMRQNTTISAVVHLLGVSVVSHLISRRLLIDGVQCSLRKMSWPRLCVLIVFLDSYLFLFTAGVLILGVGMAASAAACSLGIYLCILFYGTSKIFIYLFLSEFYLHWG